jgi:hypothetical protein
MAAFGFCDHSNLKKFQDGTGILKVSSYLLTCKASHIVTLALSKTTTEEYVHHSSGQASDASNASDRMG